MMNVNIFKHISGILLSLGCIGLAAAQENPSLFLTRANAKIANEMGLKNRWDGPTEGPKAADKKLIVFIASDFRNTSLPLLAQGVKDAAAAIGWDVVDIDCWSVPSKRADAFSRAIALKPAGIILAGLNARDSAKEIQAAKAKNIPVIGWHAAVKPGAVDGLYTNVGTNPTEAGQSAALLSVVDSSAKAGVVVFTDPSNLYSIAKSNEIADVIKRCQTCSLLGIEEIPLNTAKDKVPNAVTALIKQHGKKWTHAIAVHDSYIDLMVPMLADSKIQAIAAGDGSVSSYKRLHSKNAQIGIVPEPLHLQGWQLVDELNRAVAGAPPSGYVTPGYVVTFQNLAFHGGNRNIFDPDNGYRNEYKKIWGK